MDLAKYCETISDSDKEVKDFFQKRSDFKNIEFKEREEIEKSLKPITERLDVQSKQLEEQRDILQPLALPMPNIPAIADATQDVKPRDSPREPKMYDPDKGLNKDILLQESLPLPSQLLNASPEEITQIRDQVAADNKKLGLTKKGKSKEETADIHKLIGARRQYYLRLDDVIKSMGMRVDNATGSGMKYKQKPRNAYKILDGKYGGIEIDENKLKNKLILSCKIGGQLMTPTAIDRDTVDLLTKRFNLKKNYSLLARNVFHDRNKLANLPKHKSSGKCALKGGAIRYYSSPKDLFDRLEILTASVKAGNNSTAIFNELYEIMDELIKKGEISQDQYNRFSNKYLIRKIF